MRQFRVPKRCVKTRRPSHILSLLCDVKCSCKYNSVSAWNILPTTSYIETKRIRKSDPNSYIFLILFILGLSLLLGETDMGEVSIFRTRDWKSWLNARGVYRRHPIRHFSWFLYLKCYFWLIRGSALIRPPNSVIPESNLHNYFASNLVRRARIFKWQWRRQRRVSCASVNAEMNRTHRRICQGGNKQITKKNQAASMRYSELGWIRVQFREEKKPKVNSQCIFAVSYKIQIFRTKGSWI